jgi:carbonic anhydrase
MVSSGLVLAGSQKGQEAFNKLMEGNKRFVAENLAPRDVGDSKRKALTKGQSPFAVVVTCSDSRLAPEILFDQGLGELFVVRTAGNVLDPIAIGSVEYGVEHLHAPLLILLGHDQCGAVAATLEAKGSPEGNIGAIVKKILPAVKKARMIGGTKEDIFNNAIKENVILQARLLLKNSPTVRHLMEKGDLKVVLAVYHLSSGEVAVY